MAPAGHTAPPSYISLHFLPDLFLWHHKNSFGLEQWAYLILIKPNLFFLSLSLSFLINVADSTSVFWCQILQSFIHRRVVYHRRDHFEENEKNTNQWLENISFLQLELELIHSTIISPLTLFLMFTPPRWRQFDDESDTKKTTLEILNKNWFQSPCVLCASCGSTYLWKEMACNQSTHSESKPQPISIINQNQSVPNFEYSQSVARSAYSMFHAVYFYVFLRSNW